MEDPRQNNQDWDDGASVPEAEIPDTTRVSGLAFENDKWFYRIIATCLGMVVVFCVLGAVYLVYVGKEVPQTLTALGSTAIGAFAGVLVDTKRR